MKLFHQKKNMNKIARIKSLEKKRKREQRRLWRKYESLKRRTEELKKEKKENEEKGEATRQTIQKQKRTVQKLYHRLDCMRADYGNKCVNEVVNAKPQYVTIEDLNVSGMTKNKHLSKAIAAQKFSEFREKREKKCNDVGIEVMVVDRCYPSSKMCHCCGKSKKALKLSNRTYICECGYKEDRDYNASLNLRDAKTYKTSHGYTPTVAKYS